MKIKVTRKSWDEVAAIPRPEHRQPVRQRAVWRKLLAALSAKELKDTDFHAEFHRMEAVGPDTPSLILMNHSSFTDLNIVAALFRDRPYSIICTNDGFIGKEWLMRQIGCVPTQKFISDLTLIRDIRYCLETLCSSVVMFPEASYSFDGTETPLPKSVGKLIKKLRVPVILVKTDGAFLRDPLYNNLQKRRVKITAEVSCLLTPEEAAAMDAHAINSLLSEKFRYDHFRSQHEKGIRVTEPFRADGLHRALYKCPRCRTEGRMCGSGTGITCGACGKHYELTETGTLEAGDGITEFAFVPDWYTWERECVREELQNGSYRLETPVDILVLADLKSMYSVGDGVLIHDRDGFRLSGCNGKLTFEQRSNASYSLYADYFWYEYGDMIAIGNVGRQYYCFPKDQEHAIVAKARLAAEEAFRLAATAQE